jgi:hypothetical protein
MALSFIANVCGYIGIIAGSVTTFVGMLALIIKPFRKALIGLFTDMENKKKLYSDVNEVISTLKSNTAMSKEHDVLLKDMKLALTELENKQNHNNTDIFILKEQALCNTRDALTRIWEKSRDRGNISEFQLQNFLDLYDVYIKLGGNSYIHQIHHDILELKRI